MMVDVSEPSEGLLPATLAGGSAGTDIEAVWTWPALTLEAMEVLAQQCGTCLTAGQIVWMRGSMGVGKTTWIRALARGLGIFRPERVASPTYTLAQIHRGPIELLHVDLHRLGEQQDELARGHLLGLSPGFEALGLDEVLGLDGAVGETKRSRAVVAVEWPEFWNDVPPDRIEVGLSYAGDNFEFRRVTIQAIGEGSRAVLSVWRSLLTNMPYESR